jgi:hypothetical protein
MDSSVEELESKLDMEELSLGHISGGIGARTRGGRCGNSHACALLTIDAFLFESGREIPRSLDSLLLELSVLLVVLPGRMRVLLKHVDQCRTWRDGSSVA